MRIRVLKSFMWLLCCAVFCLPVFAENKKGQTSGTAGGMTIRKERATISRPSPGPKPSRRRVRVPAILLTLEYKVMKSGDDGRPVETNPTAIFQTGDRFQLRFKTNQNGYLYIIASTDDEDGKMIFPDRRIDNGSNFVKVEEEYIVPSKCEAPMREKSGSCWSMMSPPAGKEIFTVIFSRELIPDSIAEINRSGVTVSKALINKIVSNSNQKLNRTSHPKGQGAGRYAVWVTNKNVNDNEELIVQVVLNHIDSRRSNGK